MQLPLDVQALALLRDLGRRLPPLPPEKRAGDPTCERYKEAACLIVEERFAEAVELLRAA